MKKARPSHRRRLEPLRTAVTAVTLLATVTGCTSVPAEHWIDLEAITRAGAELEHSHLGPLIVVGTFLLAGFIAAPLTPLVVVTVLAFDLAAGFAYSLIGALLSAFLTYGVGHALGRGGIRRLAGKRLNRLSQQLARRGLVAVLAVRIVPVAPFTVVNLVAGASHIRFRDYALGSVLGMTPNMLALAVLVDRLKASVQDPGVLSTVVVVVLATIIGLGAIAARRWLLRGGSTG